MEPERSELIESVLAANTGDQAASRAEDRLGFEPYVTAMAEFLTNPSTSGPLTISIEGEWGSGKSSFMKQLKERLEELAVDPRKPDVMPLTVEFNAWRHDQSTALWAAFAVRFGQEVSSQISLWRRLRGHLILLWLRYQWSQGWLDLAWVVLMWGAIAVGAAYGIVHGWEWLEDKSFQTLGRTGLSLGGAAALLKGLARLKDRVGNPIENGLKDHVEVPDYKEKLSFIEKFHEDFSKIMTAYAGDRTVYVFIDDLDRCEVPKAAELMQALNLMISGEQQRLVFILGMDRLKVAAGLAVKHKEVLRYLRAGDRDGAQVASLGDYGLQFGYTFIEKFIQIPFVVPEPDGTKVEEYLEAMSKPPADTAPGKRRATWWSRLRLEIYGERRQRWGEVLERRTRDQKADVPPETEQQREKIRLAVTEDSPAFRRVVKVVAEGLGNNPRRLKQFVNLFRLRVFIAVETGLFDDGSLTLEQLGKFVALQLRCPLLIGDIERDPQLLQALYQRSDTPSPLAAAWLQRTEVMQLVHASFMPTPVPASPPDLSTWSLGTVDIRRLLKVSRRVRTIDMRPRTEFETDEMPAELDVYLSGYSDEVRDVVEQLRRRGLKAWAASPGKLGTYTRAPATVLANCITTQGEARTADVAAAEKLDMWSVPVLLRSYQGPPGAVSAPEFDLRQPDGLDRFVEFVLSRREPPQGRPGTNAAA